MRISQLDEAKGQWQALRTLAPERLLALRHSATIESIGSSTRLEGGELSNVEVERLLASLKQTLFATRDEQEVAGYARVMERIFESWANLTLNEKHVRQLHAELLQFSDKDTRHRGGNTRPTRTTWPPSARTARCSVSCSRRVPLSTRRSRCGSCWIRTYYRAAPSPEQ